MHATDALDLDERRPGRLGLAGLLVALAALGATLYLVAGPPHPPPTWPTAGEVLATLGGSETPLAAMGYLLVTAAWAVWLWVVGSLALRCAVVAADALGHGAGWARGLRRLSDRVTLPIVRRVVDGALVAAVVVNVAARAPAAAAAESAIPAAITAAADPRPATASPSVRGPAAGAGTVTYTVQPGDNLWLIAERCYGAGGEYRRLLTANLGRTMPHGGRLDDSGLIRPGWVLDVPQPAERLERVDGATFYVVEEGDTLRGIAARFLGDEMEWPRIFEPNRGMARLADGRTLHDPDLIWPGLRLRLAGEPAPAPAPLLRAPDRDDAGQRRPAPPPPASTPAPPPPATAPLPARPAAAPTAAAVAPTPAAVGTAAPGTAAHSARATLLYGVGPVLGGAALLGAGVYGGHRLRRRRRSLDDPPLPEEPAGDAVLRDGFAETELARTLAHRLHGEPDAAALVAGRVRRFYAEHGVDVGIVTVRHGRRRAALTLAATLEEQARLVELVEELGRRLGARGRAEPAVQNDVLLTLSGLARADLSALPDDAHDDLWLIPVGALPGGETVYVDWRELDHVLVAGRPGEGAETVLTSLVAALAARCRPDELRLRTIAHRGALPPELERLPHQLGGPVDANDREAVRAVLAEVRAELERRIQDGVADGPRLVLVLGELADVEGGQLATLGEYGPARGIHLVAASTRAEALGAALLGHFRTRAVLRLGDEAASTRILGEAGADQLEGAGDMLLSVDARPPVRLRGMRVSADHLAELARLMRTAYPAAVPDPEGAPSVDAAAPSVAAPMAEEAARDPGHPPIDDAGVAGTPAGGGSDTTDAPPEPGRGDLTEHETAAPLALPLDVGASAAQVGRNGRAAAPSGQPAVEAEAGTERADGPPVEVICFGEPRVLYRGRRIWPPDPSRFKAWELLLFLAVQPDGQATRDQLWDALWPNKDPRATADSTNALRTQLHRLREAFEQRAPDVREFVVLQRNGGPCALDPAVVCSDVHRFVGLCEEARSLPPREAKAAYRRARALYGDDLLGGQTYPWITERDETGLTLGEMYAEMHRRATKELADLLLRDGEAGAAIPLYRELLEPDPGLESLVRSLFRCHRQLGDRSGLIREERHLRAILARRAADVGGAPAEPEPKTVALYQRVLAELEAAEPAATH